MINKRGISPVIATVLLIAIVVVIAAIIFIWAANFFQEDVQKFGSDIKNSCDDIDLQVEDSSGFLEVVNRGNVPVHRVNIIVDDSGDKEVYECDLADLSPGRTDVIDTNSECDGTGSISSVIPVLVGQDAQGDNQEYVCDKNEILVS